MPGYGLFYRSASNVASICWESFFQQSTYSSLSVTRKSDYFFLRQKHKIRNVLSSTSTVKKHLRNALFCIFVSTLSTCRNVCVLQLQHKSKLSQQIFYACMITSILCNVCIRFNRDLKFITLFDLQSVNHRKFNKIYKLYETHSQTIS